MVTMTSARRRVCVWLVAGAGVLGASTASAQTGEQTYKPTVGQAGKDVVWVPTAETVVERMLDMAKVSPQDFVMDLGSGDGRNIIAAAKRGARGVGVEYNPDMVALSRRLAAEAGVADRATFVEGDMYEADISKATVLALFLLPQNLNKLVPKFLALPPGTRIVGNTFAPEGWSADASEDIEQDCTNWCKALLWIVPANVEGTWQLAGGSLSLTQKFQKLFGTLTSGSTVTEVTEGTLRGNEITLKVGGATYTGRVAGDTMSGAIVGSGQSWTANRRR
jgi:SAM-dependent methyltransferase